MRHYRNYLIAALVFALLLFSGAASNTSACDLATFGAQGDYYSNPSGYTDNTPPWHNAIAAGCTTLTLPPGWMAFKSPPDEIPSFVKVNCTAATCNMVKDYSGGRAFFILLGIDSILIENIRLFNAPGKASGSALGRSATAPGNGPQNIVLRNIVISAISTDGPNAGKFYQGIVLDGLNDAASYGSRRNMLSDIIMAGGVTDIGLVLGQNNATLVNGLVCGGEWGVWVTGSIPNRTSNDVVMSNLVNCAIQVIATGVSFFSGNSLKVSTDGDSSSNSFFASTTFATPYLGGTNNHLWANGVVYP